MTETEALTIVLDLAIEYGVEGYREYGIPEPGIEVKRTYARQQEAIRLASDFVIARRRRELNLREPSVSLKG